MNNPLCLSSSIDLTRRIYELERRLEALNDKGTKVAELIVLGQPQAQGRPRFARCGNHTIAYDPHKDKKSWIKLQLMEQFKKTPLTGSLVMNVVFYMPIPKCTSKKKSILMLSNEIKHTKKPDLDNFLKMILDCCNGIIFKDDSQIWQLNSRKVYGEELKTEINIYTD